MNAPAELWAFPVDRHIRRRYFVAESFSHPAKLHLGLLQKLIDRYTEPCQTILDPMAGSGSLMIAATQMRNVILRDLEPGYVELMLASAHIIRQKAGLLAGLIDIDQADARTLDCAKPDCIITSPPYGFETGRGMSNARRLKLLESKAYGRRWAKYLSNPTHASVASGFRYEGGSNNAGNKSGRNYWKDMNQIYGCCHNLLPSGGRMILIIKNHYRRGKLIDVVSQTIEAVNSLGFCLEARHGRYISNPSLWQRRRREQGLPIIDVEDVLVFKKG